KTDLYNEKPWLAVSFYHAFCRARDIAQQSMYDTDALTVSLPWIIDEMEGTRRLFGPQVWDYSVEGSLPTLNALLAYLDEQKLSKRRMSVNDLFVPNIGAGLADYLRATGEDCADTASAKELRGPQQQFHGCHREKRLPSPAKP